MIHCKINHFYHIRNWVLFVGLYSLGYNFVSYATVHLLREHRQEKLWTMKIPFFKPDFSNVSITDIEKIAFSIQNPLQLFENWINFNVAYTFHFQLCFNRLKFEFWSFIWTFYWKFSNLSSNKITKLKFLIMVIQIHSLRFHP